MQRNIVPPLKLAFLWMGFDDVRHIELDELERSFVENRDSSERIAIPHAFDECLAFARHLETRLHLPFATFDKKIGRRDIQP